MKFVKWSVITNPVLNPDTLKEYRGIKLAIDNERLRAAVAENRLQEFYEDIIESLKALDLSSDKPQRATFQLDKPKAKTLKEIIKPYLEKDKRKQNFLKASEQYYKIVWT